MSCHVMKLAMSKCHDLRHLVLPCLVSLCRMRLDLSHLTLPPLALPCLVLPCLIIPHLTSPHLTSHSPHLTSHSPHLTSHYLTSPHLTLTSHSPHLTSPHLTSPHLTSPHLTSPHLMPSTGPYHGGAPPICFEGAPDDPGLPKGPHKRPQGSQVGSSVPFGCHGPHSGKLPVCLQFSHGVCCCQKVNPATNQHIVLHKGTSKCTVQLMMSWIRARQVPQLHAMFTPNTQAVYAASGSHFSCWCGALPNPVPMSMLRSLIVQFVQSPSAPPIMQSACQGASWEPCS